MKRANAVVGQRVVVKANYYLNLALIGKLGTVVYDDGLTDQLLLEFDDAFADGHDGNTSKFKGINGKCWWISSKHFKKVK